MYRPCLKQPCPSYDRGQGLNYNTPTPRRRHGVYFHTPEQEAAAKAVFEKEQGKYGRPIVTECLPAMVYWPAEEYHQSA